MKAFKIGNQIIGRQYQIQGSVTVEGVPPLTLTDATAGTLSAWEIDGQSEQGNIVLPSGYTQLEYIESSGTQYIMTGLFPGGTKLSAEVKFQASASAVSSSNYPCLFSCFTEDSIKSTSNVYSFGIYNGKWRYKLLANQGYGANVDTSIHTIHWNKDDGTRLDSDTAWIASRVTVRSSNTLELPLFTRKANTGIVEEAFWSGKVYYAKFWNDSNALVRNFVPAKNSSDVVGMYDLVSGTFFTNAGSGSFTAGGEISPTPTNPIDVKGVGKIGSGLPSGYKRLEYIQSSDGSDANTPYINTNYKPNYNTKLSAKVIITKSAKIAGDMATANAQTTFTINVSANFNARFGTNNIPYSDRLLVDSGEHIITMSKDGSYIDDTLDCSFPVQTTWASNSDLYLFKFNGATSNNQAFKLKWFKIWDNDVLVREFIPAKNSSNVIGMYDTVTNTFFTNAGSGTFIAGPEDTSYVLPVKVSNGTTETTTNINISAALQKIGTYTDIVKNDGTLTRGVGVKVLTGTESWQTYTYQSSPNAYYIIISDMIETSASTSSSLFMNTHLQYKSGMWASADIGYAVSTMNRVFFRRNTTDTVDTWKSWLASQYAAGTPVMIYYPLATATTEQITVPSISIGNGTNYIDTDTDVKPSSMSVTFSGGSATVTKVITMSE